MKWQGSTDVGECLGLGLGSEEDGLCSESPRYRGLPIGDVLFRKELKEDQEEEEAEV